MAKVARGDVAGILLPDSVSEEILRGAAEQSLIRRFGRERQMTANAQKLTEAEVTGANVFWVSEGGRKQTDAPPMVQRTWTMTAAELAVIVPLDENVAEDATLDLFGLYTPEIQTAVARKIDAAALFGDDAPSSWSHAIVNGAVTSGNVFTESATPTDVALLNLLAGTGATTPDGALQAIEEDGLAPNAWVAYSRFKARLRGLKDADNRYIFGDAVEAGVPGALYGLPISFAGSTLNGGIWQPTKAHVVVGDFSKAFLGIRQELRYKLFDQGVITDGAGNVVYSLMENDMVALRVTGRFGFKIIANNTADGTTLGAGSDFPFAVVRPAQA